MCPAILPRILQGAGTDKKVIARLAVALKSGKKFEGKAINYKKDGTPFIMYWRVLPIKPEKTSKPGLLSKGKARPFDT